MVRAAFSRAWARIASRGDAHGIARPPAPDTRASLVDADRKHYSDWLLDHSDDDGVDMVNW